jgi:hypothetical protein
MTSEQDTRTAAEVLKDLLADDWGYHFPDEIIAALADAGYTIAGPGRSTDDGRLVALFERLAAIEHERWSDWQSYMHGQCQRLEDGCLVIPAALVKQWNRQIATSYAKLSEQEKESDRDQVRRYWHLIALDPLPTQEGE